MDFLKSVEGFDWDEGNKDKNWIRHQVQAVECEAVFFNQPLIIINDEKHSQTESRYYAYGKTNIGRKLMVVFCIRGKRIRIISARDMNKKEGIYYEEQENS